jgi:TRAP-type C4-dicarboxylate transport system substrate-binding protein
MIFFTRFSTKTTHLLATAAVGMMLAPAIAQAEDKVSAVHAFPDFLVYTKTFLAMVDDINERGKGIVQIEVRGGPEAIGMFQQPAAVRDGVVDMVHTPGSFYGANVPEIDAMVASRVTPMEARANGGAAIMDQAHQERFNVKHLGWIDGGIKFHIYMDSEPKFRAEDGVLDLTGVKLRDNPIYHAFFEAMNATTASMPSTEVYSALEKGVVDAAAWTEIGIPQLKWNEFLSYRVDPTFYNTDIGVIFNLDAWNALTPESQTLIQDVMIEWEGKSYTDRQEEIAIDAKILSDGGMKFVSHTPEAGEAYRQLADDAAWARMSERMDGSGAGAERYKALRKTYALED